MVQLAALFLVWGSAVESRRIPITEFPCDRVTGVAREGNTWLVGGIRGLFLGEPGGAWRELCDQSVRHMRSGDNGTWVLYGNGSIDKVEIQSDRIYNDVLRGVVKRPWAASMWVDGNTLYVGSHGGWIKREGEKIEESYPAELSGKPVTAICPGKSLSLGTQDGVFHTGRNRRSMQRIGFSSGLPDVWVTALLPSDRGTIVGLAAGGLVLKDSKIRRLEAPSLRVRHLERWHDCLVMGALEGAWLRQGDDWQQLVDEETTFLSKQGDELVLGTPSGLHFYRWQGSTAARQSTFSYNPSNDGGGRLEGVGSRKAQSFDAFALFQLTPVLLKNRRGSTNRFG